MKPYAYIKKPHFVPCPAKLELFLEPALTPEPNKTASCFAFVFNDKAEILLVKTHNRGWSLPGGGREGNETTEEAVIREIMEEGAVCIVNLEPVGFHRITCDGEKPQDWSSSRTFPIFYQQYFVANVAGIEKFTPNDEISEARFFPLSEAIEMEVILYQFTRILLDQALKMKG